MMPLSAHMGGGARPAAGGLARRPVHAAAPRRHPGAFGRHRAGACRPRSCRPGARRAVPQQPRAVNETESATGSALKGESGRRVALAVDGSDVCKEALAWVLSEVVRADDVLHVIYVVESPVHFTLGGAIVTPPVEDSVKEMEEVQPVVTEDYVIPSAEAGVHCLGHIVRERIGETIADAILRVARRESVDIIVVIGHQRMVIQSMITGSVQQQLMDHSDIPLLMYPASFSESSSSDDDDGDSEKSSGVEDEERE